MSAVRRRHAGSHHLPALVVACLVLGGNLLPLVHYASVRHATCLEHGDLIHLRSANSDATANSVADRSLRDRPGLSAQPTSLSGHSHETCPVCGTSREAVVSAESRLSFPRPADAVWVALHEGDARPSGSIYSFAPKHSPPA